MRTIGEVVVLRRSLVPIALAASGIVVAACGGGERPADGGVGDTAAVVQAPPATPGPTASGGADPASPQLIALGDSIFNGQVAGGTCVTCHGQGGTGGTLGPNLSDAEWLHGDGSYEFIVTIVNNGITTPKQFPAAMPPKGGAPLTPDQVRAVAAYVYALGRTS